MKNYIYIFVFILSFIYDLSAQTCGVAQTLNSTQNSQINSLRSPLDSNLKYENLFKIDSLSNELKLVFGAQGGRPDAIEQFYNLTTNTNWLNLSNALILSRTLIGNDSLVYVNLWKAAKGMGPPAYQPHSLFLRASAEIATGLLKIASKETDLNRKALYQLWATRALDSLVTMQLPNGAFPFPDLRTYGDPNFGPIIQNFMFYCGPDSVNVLQNGFIINDKGTGEFKFDAGVIANAYFEAYNYTGNINYKNIAISIGNYLKPLKFNFNYNYNTFASLGLTRAYQLTNDTSYLNRAIKNLRYCVFPGQIANGRWVDGHNANSRYHSVIIQNIVFTSNLLPNSHPFTPQLKLMAKKAIKNLADYSYNCGVATGYRWLIKAYQADSNIVNQTLKDSLKNLIGRHINQSAINGKFLDVPTMGEYIELLDLISGIEEIKNSESIDISLFPNPSNNLINFAVRLKKTEPVELKLISVEGKLVKVVDIAEKLSGDYACEINLSGLKSGVYILNLSTGNHNYFKKIIKVD